MKYSPLESTREKLLHIGNLNKGLDLSQSPLYIDSAALSDGKNVIFKNGAVKTRPGISADESNIVTSEFTDEAFYNAYSISESEFFIDGSYYRIMTEASEVTMSQFCLSMFLVDRDREVTPTGSLQFNRVTDDVFYLPSGITFFQGSPQNGSGIFVFVRRNNIGDYTQSLHEVYELNSNMDSWEMITDFYTPTVYINGRGNMYESAAQASQYSADEPLLLEAPNMLNGSFYAYYSSDGYSSDFSLPFSEISDEAVICRIHYSPTDYTDWTVLSGETKATQSFMGVDVTMNVDRSKGLVYFTVAAGDYSVPAMSRYRFNNIKITAVKTIENAFEDVVSCSCCQVTDSRIILSGGQKANRIYSASFENPLYFPQTNTAEIGEARLPVTALTLQNDKIIAFKSSGIYEIKLKKGKALNTKSLLADNDSVFYGADTLSCEVISPDLGCIEGKAITVIQGRTVFMATDGNVYSLSSSLDIIRLSDKIRGRLEGIADYIKQEAIVLNDGEFCYFFTEHITLAARIGKDSDKTEWYIWELPQNLRVINGISRDGSPILLCNCNRNTCYLALLNGRADILLDCTAETAVQTQNITSSITTAHLAPKGINLTKKLNRVYITLDCKGNTEISLNGRSVDFSQTDIGALSGDSKRITVFPEIRRFNSVYITLKSDEYLSLLECDIYYCERLY